MNNISHHHRPSNTITGTLKRLLVSLSLALVFALIIPSNSYACNFNLAKVNLRKPGPTVKQILSAIQDENEANLATVRDRLYNEWFELNGNNPRASREIASAWHGVLDELAPSLLESFEENGVSTATRLKLCNPLAEFYNSIAANGQPGVQWLTRAIGG